MLVTLSNFIWIWIMWLLFNWIAQLNGCLGCLASGSWLSYPAFSPRLPDLPKFSISSTSSHLNSTNYDHVLWVYGLFKPCWLTHGTCTCFRETALLFNVQLSCFMNFILCPTDKYILKVNNEKIRLICWMSSKFKLNTTWHRSGVFIVDFDQSQYINIEFLLLTLNMYLSVGCRR